MPVFFEISPINRYMGILSEIDCITVLKVSRKHINNYWFECFSYIAQFSFFPKFQLYLDDAEDCNGICIRNLSNVRTEFVIFKRKIFFVLLLNFLARQIDFFK